MWSYFLHCLIDGIASLILFGLARNTAIRNEMVISSLIGLMSGWFSPLYAGISWSPDVVFPFQDLGVTFDIESFIFGFVLFGIGANLTSLLTGGGLVPCELRNYLRFLPIIVLYPRILFAAVDHTSPGSAVGHPACCFPAGITCRLHPSPKRSCNIHIFIEKRSIH